ncbi:MAG TPA: hypothetical protein DCE42_08730, partial [Myxococcales bacterium]|nr:hypothetical protein [Myxococcales bacterium]
ARYQGYRVYQRASQWALLVARPLLRWTRRFSSPAVRHLALLTLFLCAGFLPYLLRPLSLRVAAFVQIFWSMAILGAGLSIAFVHFLVEKEQDAIASGLLGRTRSRYSEVPLARFLAFEGLVALPTLGVACVGMMIGFLFMVQGLYDIGLQSWYIVHGPQPTLWTWTLYTLLSVFRALDIFDTFATFHLTVGTVFHKGFVASFLVFVFKAIFDLLLLAKIRDWWSKRALALEAIEALAHAETRKKAQETLRRCRKYATAPLLQAFETSNKVEVKVAALQLLQEIGYAERETLFLLALQSKEEQVRQEAARLLGTEGSKAALSGLRKVLVDVVPEVRACAAEGLAMPAFVEEVTPLLHKALQDPMGIVREKAAIALQKLAAPSSRPFLLEALQDKEGHVRRAVVAAVARYEDEIFSSLAPMLHDPHKDVRMQALKAIAELQEKEPDKVDSLMLGALKDSEEAIRLEALSVLRWNQSTQVIPAVGETLLHDVSSAVRKEAASVLGYMESKQAVEPLFAALHDPHYQVRCQVIEALGDLRAKNKIGDLLTLINDGDRDVRKQVVTTLGELGVRKQEVLAALVQALTDTDEEVRKVAVEALAMLTDGKDPALLRGLEDPHAAVRIEAIFALHSPIEEVFMPALLDILADQDEDRDVRKAAIEAFSHYNLEDWASVEARVRPLFGALMKEDDLVLREEVVSSIGMIGYEGATRELNLLLQNDVSDIRKAAATAMSFLDEPQAVYALVAALKDEAFRVRAAAAEALAEHAEKRDIPQAMEPLIAAMKDEELEVRKQAAFALAQIKAPAAQKTLLDALQDRETPVCVAAAEALGLRNTGKDPQDPEAQEVVSALLEALQVQEAEVRTAAAEGLAHIRNPQVVEALAHTLRKDPVDWTRLAAVMSLKQLEDHSAIPALQDAMLHDEDEWIRGEAYETLGEWQVDSVLPLLCQQLKNDPSPQARQVLVKTLVEFNDPEANAELAQALLEEHHPDVRKEIVRAFSTLALVEHVDLLDLALVLEQEARVKRMMRKVHKELLDAKLDKDLKELDDMLAELD